MPRQPLPDDVYDWLTYRYRQMKEPLQDKYRKRIFDRDGQQCRYCGSDEWLELCHITDAKIFANVLGMDRFEESYRDDNLITMCNHCHRIQTGLVQQVDSDDLKSARDFQAAARNHRLIAPFYKGGKPVEALFAPEAGPERQAFKQAILAHEDYDNLVKIVHEQTQALCNGINALFDTIKAKRGWYTLWDLYPVLSGPPRFPAWPQTP